MNSKLNALCGKLTNGEMFGSVVFRSRDSKKGFALVVTLTLMVLLSILAVGLLSLSSIQLRKTAVSSELGVARANARLALMMAIGQLQTHTGSDRRVTMVADQLSGGSDGNTTAAAERRKHWTGVYKAWRDDRTEEVRLGEITQRPEPEFVSWLVSGEDTFTGSVDSAKSGGGADLVELLGEGTLGSGNKGSVEAPLMQVMGKDGKVSGNLAWWTGDQGVKAAFALPEPLVDSEVLARNNVQAAGRTGIQSMSSGSSKPFEGVDMDDAKVGAVGSFQQSSFFASAENEQMPLFHDIAGYSTGLLTNVVKGGFRKDLSMELERDSDTDFPLKGNHAADRPDPRLYTINGARKDVGINLQELWLHYNVYKQFKTGSLAYTTGGSIPGGTPYLSLPADPASALAEPFGSYKLMPIISYQSLFSFESERVTVDGQQKYRMRVVVDPILVIWNPLDVPVALPTVCNYSIKYWVIPYDIQVSVNGGAKVRCPMISTTSGSRIASAGSSAKEGDYNFLSFNAGSEQQLVLKPGEVVKVSQASINGGKLVKSDNSIGHYLQGKAGFNFGAGVSLPLRTVTGETVDINAADRVTYELEPNNLTSGQYGGTGHSLTGGNLHSGHFAMTMHGNYLNTTRNGDYVTGGLHIDRGGFNGQRPTPYAGNVSKPNNERMYATDFPNVFRKFSGVNDTRSFSASDVEGVKAPFMLFSYNVKTERSSDLGTKSLSRFNPTVLQHDFVDLSQTERDLNPYEINIEGLTSWINNKIETSPNGQGYFGGGMNAEFGSPFVVTNSIPREPLVSLGALQHAFANGFFDTSLARSRQPLLPEVNHAIGNSFAPSCMPRDQVRSLQNSPLTAKRTLADHSYLANLALWDDWFFSSVAPRKGESQKEVADKFLTAGKGLPNSRYIAETAGKAKDDLLAKLFQGGKPVNKATYLMASLMRVEGLFNVNSTSVEAWKAMLSSLAGQKIVERDANGATTVKLRGKNTPSAALLSSRPENDPDDAGPNSYWDGGRELEVEEIESLAEEIVKEVRKRGPFISLADFVNRRVGNDKELAVAGVLQSAIDRTDINSAYEADDRSVADVTAGRFPFGDAEKGPKSQGAAGILDQADVLTPIAPVLSVRSDSFIIRGYGEATDGAGVVKAKAWCEAVVERGNAYTDGVDSPEVAYANLTSEMNRTFGRPYRIVSFKWLGPGEV